MIRITLEKEEWIAWTGKTVPAVTEVKEFEDEHKALDWLMRKSYFEETYTRRMTWERVDS